MLVLLLGIKSGKTHSKSRILCLTLFDIDKLFLFLVSYKTVISAD